MLWTPDIFLELCVKLQMSDLVVTGILQNLSCQRPGKMPGKCQACVRTQLENIHSDQRVNDVSNMWRIRRLRWRQLGETTWFECFWQQGPAPVLFSCKENAVECVISLICKRQTQENVRTQFSFRFTLFWIGRQRVVWHISPRKLCQCFTS